MKKQPLFLLAPLFLSLLVLVQAIPQNINYQAVLKNKVTGRILPDGVYTITYRLYTEATGGNSLWAETSLDTASNGILTHVLGSVTSINLAFDAAYYLAIQVQGDTEMVPRERLTSIGYAFNADRLDGQLSSFYQNAGNLTAGTLPTGRLVGTYSSATVGYSSNADRVDGQHGSYYQSASNLTTGTLPSARLVGSYSSATAGYTNNADLLDGQHGSFYQNASNLNAGTVSSTRLVGSYNSATVGYSSNADRLDGQHGSYYQSASNLTTGILPSGRLVGSYASASVNYATNAGNANTLDGFHATAFSKAQFDAIVAPTGGDYTTIRQALAAGKKTIFIRNGTYQTTSGITITQNGTTIIGETRDGVIIDFSDSTTGFLYANGDSTGYYSAGSCKVTYSSATVDGHNTAWLTNTAPGEFILLGQAHYKISAVSSDTQLVLNNKYNSFDTIFRYPKIAAYLQNLHLENLTITRSSYSNGAVFWNYVKNSRIQHCNISNNNRGIWLDDSIENHVTANICNNNESVGIYVSGYSAFNSLIENQCNNNQYGIGVDALNCTVAKNRCNNNYYGISLDGGDYNTLSENQCNYSICGIIILLSDNNIITGCVSNQNQHRGIYVNSGTVNNIITSCQAVGNGINIEDLGTGTIKANNYAP